MVKLDSAIFQPSQTYLKIYPCQRTIDNLNDLWSQLEELLNKKRKRLEHEQKLDCWREKSQKIQIWIEEKLPTAENENYGESIGEVNALKDALLRLQNEINGKYMSGYDSVGFSGSQKASYCEVSSPGNYTYLCLKSRGKLILRLFDVNGRSQERGR